jgi:transcription initiation factor IIF auxiliary subunit
VEGFPLRSWSIEVYLLNEHGEEIPATLFDKVIYRLHPSFGPRATQSTSLSRSPPSSCLNHRLTFSAIKHAPFRIQEEGWGEFDMQIGFVADKEHAISHDLNFQQSRYESKHTIVRPSFPNIDKNRIY